MVFRWGPHKETGLISEAKLNMKYREKFPSDQKVVSERVGLFIEVVVRWVSTVCHYIGCGLL